MPESQVKGLIFQGARRWMLRRYGEAGLESFIAKLPEPDRALWTSDIILPMSWLPASAYTSMYEAQESLWGTGDGQLFQEAAAAVAFDDLSSVMKLFMKLGSPSFIAKRFPTVWDRYFSGGRYRVITLGSNELVAEVEDARAYGEAGCHGTMGWTRQALTYSGAKSLRIEHTECVFAGAARCVFRCAWQ